MRSEDSCPAWESALLRATMTMHFMESCICTDPLSRQHLVPEAPAGGIDGVGVFTQPGALREAGDVLCGSRLCCFLTGVGQD